MMDYQINLTNWQQSKQPLSSIRRTVFIDEQKVPEELEWDEDDKHASHILVTYKNNPIATARLKPDGHIGRMAVLKEYRHKGIGSAILKKLIETAIQMGLESVYLHAQVLAIPFYEKHGFEVYTDVFMDAGIPHKSMRYGLK